MKAARGGLLRRLSETLRVGEVELQALAGHSYPEAIPESFIDYTRRRVAPKALEGSSHHRALWMWRPFDFCPETWEVLVSRCPGCKAELRWTTTTHVSLCGSCGFDLRDLRAGTVAAEHRRPLKHVIALANQLDARPSDVVGELPRQVAELSGAELLQLIVILGRAQKKQAERSDLRDQLTDFSHRDLASGMSAVRKIDAVIRDHSPLGKNASESAFLRRLASSAETAQGALGGVLRRLLRRHAGGMSGVERLRADRIAQGALTTTEAAKILRIERSRMARLCESEPSNQAEVRGEARHHRWISPQQVREFRSVLDDRVSMSSWGARHGLSPLAVAQLVSCGLLQLDGDPRYASAFSGRQLIRASADQLMAKLAEVSEFATSGFPEWVFLRNVFDCIGAAHKPWPILVLKAIERDPSARIRFRTDNTAHWSRNLPPTERVHSERAMVQVKVGERIRRAQLFGTPHEFSWTPPSDAWRQYLTPSEAEAYLNCGCGDSNLLKKIGALDGFDRNMGGYPRSKVEAFGAEHISSREIAALLRRSVNTIDSLLKKLGFQRSVGSFWVRSEILANGAAAIRHLEVPYPYSGNTECEVACTPELLGQPVPRNRLGLHIPELRGLNERLRFVASAEAE